jgi:hypothetical protein
MYATYQVYAKLNFVAQVHQYFEMFIMSEAINSDL